MAAAAKHAADFKATKRATAQFYFQRILPRTLIAEKIWASHYDVDTNLLDVYMSRLRNKLETASGRTLFKTVRGVGYQLL